MLLASQLDAYFTMEITISFEKGQNGHPSVIASCCRQHGSCPRRSEKGHCRLEKDDLLVAGGGVSKVCRSLPGEWSTLGKPYGEAPLVEARPDCCCFTTIVALPVCEQDGNGKLPL